MSELPQRDVAPEGVEFVYDAAKAALDEQLAWIGDLDTKAGVLLGAVAVLFGLLFVEDSLLLEAPVWLSAVVAFVLGLSALLSALAFHVSEWQTPGFDDLCALEGQGDNKTLKWKALTDVKDAFNKNEKLLEKKANKLWWAGRSLLAGIILLAAYLIYRMYFGV
jgi:hypothetical protein